MTNIPWREGAALIRTSRATGTGEVTRELVVEGSLGTVVQYVRKLDAMSRTSLKVTLPDRRVPPFEFAGEELNDLCSAYLNVAAAGKR
jgi:hypothetical protein